MYILSTFHHQTSSEPNILQDKKIRLTLTADYIIAICYHCCLHSSKPSCFIVNCKTKQKWSYFSNCHFNHQQTNFTAYFHRRQSPHIFYLDGIISNPRLLCLWKAYKLAMKSNQFQFFYNSDQNTNRQNL